MKFIIMGRQGGKTTELFRWLARGKPIEAEYLGSMESIWSRAIVTVTEERMRSTKRHLQRWAYIHPAYKDSTPKDLEPLLGAVYDMETVREARGPMYRPMRDNLIQFALDDADAVLERLMCVPLSVVTFSGETYERESGEIEPPIQPRRRAERESNVDEMLRSALRKGDLTL